MLLHEFNLSSQDANKQDERSKQASLRQVASFSAQNLPSSKLELAKPGAVESPEVSIRSFRRSITLWGGWEPREVLKRFSG